MVIIYGKEGGRGGEWEGGTKKVRPLCVGGGGKHLHFRRGVKKVWVDNRLISTFSNGKRNFFVYKTLARV